MQSKLIRFRSGKRARWLQLRHFKCCATRVDRLSQLDHYVESAGANQPEASGRSPGISGFTTAAWFRQRDDYVVIAPDVPLSESDACLRTNHVTHDFNHRYLAGQGW